MNFKIPKNNEDRKSLFLGLFTTVCLIAVFCVIWFSGLGRQEQSTQTTQKELQSTKSKTQKQSSISKKSRSSSEVSQSTLSSETSTVSKIEPSSVYVAKSVTKKQENSTQERETRVYQATVGNSSKSSTLSQKEAQEKAQVALKQAQAQEKANQQEAQRIKSSIEQADPNTQVNIIQQGD